MVDETLADQLEYYSIDLDEVLIYLDHLRETGVTNMFGARPYIQREYLLPKQEAGDALKHWMDTFSKRHPVTV